MTESSSGFITPSECSTEWRDNSQWAVRDSLMKTYQEKDPLSEQLFQYWNRKELDLDNEIYPQLIDKLKY